MLIRCTGRLLQRSSIATSWRGRWKGSITSPASSKEYPTAPNVGIGVVILRRLEGLSQVLLVRRGKEPQKGLLTFPGGSLELGETMSDCAIRETLEETGLMLRNRSKGNVLEGRALDCPRPVDAVDSIHYDRSGRVQYQYTIVDMAAVPEDPSAAPQAADDVDEVFWAPIEGLRGMKELGEHCARIAEDAASRFDIP